MAPKQAKLGKFVGKSGDAPKQQSTLSFKTPSSRKEGKVANGHKQSSGKVKQEDGDEDEEMTNGAGEVSTAKKPSKDAAKDVQPSGFKSEVSSTDEGSPLPTSSTPVKQEVSPAIKRTKTIADGSEEDEDEDDEPVRKKPRRSVQTTKPSSKDKSNARSAGKSVEKSLASKPSTTASIFNQKGAEKKLKHAETSDSSKKPKPKEDGISLVSHKDDKEINDDEDPDENEEDEEEDAEEEKPEVAKKNREKVQSTLSSQGKDPYPDWKPGEPVPYAALCTTFSLVELTTKRLIISAYCSAFLRQVLRLTPQDLLPTVQLMINKLAADYAGIELGIGESLIMKAIGESTGRTLQVIKQDQSTIGDLGLVAIKSRSNQKTMFKPKPLTVRGVLDGLMSIAIVQGSGSQGQKVAGIRKLLSSADLNLKSVDITKDKGGPSEAKFIIRFLEGKLRLGLAERTMVVALAHAMVFHEKAAKGDKVPSAEQLAKGESILKTVFSELPSYEVIIPAMLEHGIFHLRENCKLQPGVPLKPMLAKPTRSITEVLDRFEGKNFTCEYKYDGERAQIHYVAEDSPYKYAAANLPSAKGKSGISAIFSRNSEDLSKKYPDVLAKLSTWIKADTKSFVLDCETVAWDLVEKKVLPFQQLMTRKRKDVKVEDVKVKVCVFAFDMLFYNGEAVVEKSLRERRELLHEAFTPIEGEFAFAQYGNTSDLEEIQTLLDDSVKASCEGLMVKMLDTADSGYEPSKRSRNWLKIKKDYLAGIGDSLDLVVVGAYHGKGKRTSVYGAFLLACYNAATQNYETVCNIGTGFSEAVLEELHAELSDITIERPKPFYVHSAVPKDQPDVWFEPRFVWEVKTADLTLSPRYKAGCDALGDVSGKGVSLRFPRFIKRRDDKTTEEATGARGLVEMYWKQESVAGAKGGGVDDDFEY